MASFLCLFPLTTPNTGLDQFLSLCKKKKVLYNYNKNVCIFYIIRLCSFLVKYFILRFEISSQVVDFIMQVVLIGLPIEI